MTRRNWIKIYPEGFLRRTLYCEIPDPGERWVWIGFLCLAGDNAFDGKICLTDDMGYTDEQLAKLLDVGIDALISAKEKMIKYKKISVDKNNVICILSWKTYQSEYKRQRDYRIEYKKLQRKVTDKSYSKKLPIDRDIDIDIEEDKDKEKNNSAPSELEAKPKINFNFTNRKWENITKEDAIFWKETYPACDIKTELKKAKGWLVGNPNKKKKNYMRFINNWLSRRQESGGSFKGEKYNDTTSKQYREVK